MYIEKFTFKIYNNCWLINVDIVLSYLNNEQQTISMDIKQKYSYQTTFECTNKMFPKFR